VQPPSLPGIGLPCGASSAPHLLSAEPPVVPVQLAIFPGMPPRTSCARSVRRWGPSCRSGEDLGRQGVTNGEREGPLSSVAVVDRSWICQKTRTPNSEEQVSGRRFVPVICCMVH
jgi:hypothetical protein